MNTFNKKFIIKHEDMFGEKNFEIVKGNIFFENKNKKYIYEAKDGKCEVLVENKSATIIKNQNIFKIDFTGKKNKCLYQNENLKFELFIFGKKISYDEKNKLVSIQYEIYDKNEKLNEINFSIKEI